MRLTAGTFAFVLGSVVAVAAQNTTTPPSPEPNSKPTDKITVTGCLQKASEASTPATGTTGAERISGASFVLINAKTGALESQPADGTTYVVEGGDLAAMVGQRVEVVGRMTPVPTGTTGATPASERHEAGTVTAETPGSVTPTSTANTPRIRVESAKSVGDCSSNR
jgi:hypothetical protein